MDVLEAIQARRSVRHYKDDPVSSEDVEQLISAAVWAPSGGNTQSWRFVVVRDRERIRRLRMVSPGMPGPPPCVIAVCQDVESAERRGAAVGRHKLTLFDSAMATQNILLAAHAIGLGTCTVVSFHAEAVRSVLELPAEVEPILLVTVGRAAEAPAVPARQTKEVAFYETYGGRRIP